MGIQSRPTIGKRRELLFVCEKKKEVSKNFKPSSF